MGRLFCWYDECSVIGILQQLTNYYLDPAPTLSFPLYFQDENVVYPQFAYLLRKEVIPIWEAALIAFIVPFFFSLCFKYGEELTTGLLPIWDF